MLPRAHEAGRLAGRRAVLLSDDAGRRSGKPHTIEIWFGLAQERLYLLAGGRDRSDWVRNLLEDHCVSVRIAETHFAGRAEPVTDAAEEAMARRLLVDKYQPSHDGELETWGHESLPVAVSFGD